VSEPGSSKRVLGLAIKGSLVVYILGAALAFSTQILLARLMGAAEYGIYYYAFSWLVVIALVGQLGFDQAMLRFLPVYIQDSDWSKAKGIISAGSKLALLSQTTLSVLMVLSVLAMGDSLSGTQRTTLIIAALCLPLRGLIYVRQATLRGFMYTVRSLLPDAVIQPVILIGLVLVLFSTRDLSSAPAFMTATFVALFLSFLIGAYWKTRLTPTAITSAMASYEVRKWLRIAFMLLIINGAHILLGNADLLILGFFRDSADVGVYGVSSRVASVVTFILIATYPVFAPMIARDHAAGRQQDLQRSIAYGMRPVSVIAAVLSIVLIVWGSQILGLFGEEFEGGKTALTILVVGQLVNALCGPVALLLAYGGKEYLTAKVLVGVLVISVVLQLSVIPTFGMEGAAFVTATSVVLWNIALYVLARRNLQIDASGWFPIRG